MLVVVLPAVTVSQHREQSPWQASQQQRRRQRTTPWPRWRQKSTSRCFRGEIRRCRHQHRLLVVLLRQALPQLMVRWECQRRGPPGTAATTRCKRIRRRVGVSVSCYGRSGLLVLVLRQALPPLLVGWGCHLRGPQGTATTMICRRIRYTRRSLLPRPPTSVRFKGPPVEAPGWHAPHRPARC